MPEVAVERKKAKGVVGGEGGETKSGGIVQSVLEMQSQLGNDQTVKTVLGPDMPAKFTAVVDREKGGSLFFATSTYKQVSKLLASYAAKHASKPSAWRRAEAGALDGLLEAWFSSKDSRGTSIEAKAKRSAMRWLEPKVKDELGILRGETPTEQQVDTTSPSVEEAPQAQEKIEDEVKAPEPEPVVEQVVENAKDDVGEDDVSSIASKTRSDSQEGGNEDAKSASQSLSSSSSQTEVSEPPIVAKLPEPKYNHFKPLNTEYAHEFKRGGVHLADVYSHGMMHGPNRDDIAKWLEGSFAKWKRPTFDKYWDRLVEIFGSPKEPEEPEKNYDDVDVSSVASRGTNSRTLSTASRERRLVDKKRDAGERRDDLEDMQTLGIKWAEFSAGSVSSVDSNNNTRSSGEMLKLQNESRIDKARVRLAEVKQEKLNEITDSNAVKVKKKSTDEERAKYRLTLGTTIKRGPENETLDTKDMVTNQSGAGFGIFVMGQDGQIYVGSHKVGVFHHSSFLAGGNVAGAGEIKVSGGKLVALTNKSGHYQPEAEQNAQVIAELKAAGISPSSYKFTNFMPGLKKEFASASEYLDKVPNSILKPLGLRI